jgi:hypothetical protein
LPKIPIEIDFVRFDKKIETPDGIIIPTHTDYHVKIRVTQEVFEKINLDPAFKSKLEFSEP